MAAELNENERRIDNNRRNLEARRELMDRHIIEDDGDRDHRESKARRKMNDRRMQERRDDE